MATIQPPKDRAEQAERLRLVVSDCEQYPENWMQTAVWHCGSDRHCFGGLAYMRAIGLRPDEPCDECKIASMWGAKTWLGVEGIEGSHGIFMSWNTLPDLRRIVQSIIDT
jgi:hypothetical protein